MVSSTAVTPKANYQDANQFYDDSNNNSKTEKDNDLGSSGKEMVMAASQIQSTQTSLAKKLKSAKSLGSLFGFKSWFCLLHMLILYKDQDFYKNTIKWLAIVRNFIIRYKFNSSLCSFII